MIDRFAVVAVFTSDQAREAKTVPAQQIQKRILIASDKVAGRGQTGRNGELSLDETLAILNSKGEYIKLYCKDVNSHRSRLQVIQVARTLADLDDSEQTKREHFAKAYEIVVGSRQKLLKSLEL